MDIDEFLDRELSDIGSPMDKADRPKTGRGPELRESAQPSPLYENTISNLGKSNLEQAEQSYNQLWRMLQQQKLKWNSELYSQLSAISRQFSSSLSYAYAEMKKKADHANELISRARNALREGKTDAPFRLYSEMEEINNSIPNVFFEEKRLISEQIIDFYKELKNTTDNELIKRVSSLTQEINQLMDKIATSIRLNDMENAAANYNKCIDLFSQIPEGFLRYKNSTGIRLLEIYKILGIYTEISELQKQLSQQPSQLKPQSQASAPAKISQQASTPQKSALLKAKKERARTNINQGMYTEASRDIQEALQLEPNDAEAKVLQAKIKTLQ